MDPATFSPVFAPFFLLAIYGWGGLGRRFCDRRLFRFHALQAILGLALLNVIGGLLNLLGLAKPLAITALMLGGAALGLVELWKTRPWTKLKPGLQSAPVLVALGFAFAADFMLSNSEVFNPHDDFHTYAVRPVRMVETGTMAGNAFDPLALDSFGSQSFFHGFFLWGTDIRFLNGFDAVACFALCLMLVAELSMCWRLPWVTGVLAVLCVAVINPQCMNISPLYSGVAAIMALVICGWFLERSLSFGPKRNNRRAEITLALLAAWLLTLKITLAMFGALFLVLFYSLLLASKGNRVGILKSAALTAGAAIMLALPWVIMPLPALFKVRNLGLQLEAGATVAAKYPSMAGRDIPAIFSTAPLLYGDRPISFLLLVAFCAGMGLFCAWVSLRRNVGERSAVGITIAAAGLAVAPVYFALGHLFPVFGAIRYACPMLIGVFLATALGYLRLKGWMDSKKAPFVISGFMTLAILIFSGTFWLRAQQGAADRTLLALQVNAKLADYSRKLVSQDERNYQRSIQELMPRGTTALVWTVAPFQLDYSRNHLLTLSTSGITNPALKFPAGADLDSFKNYLRDNGVRFVLMETNGYAANKLAALQELKQSSYAAIQKMADFGIYLRGALLELAQRNPVRYSDDRMLLFELADTPADRARTKQ